MNTRRLVQLTLVLSLAGSCWAPSLHSQATTWKQIPIPALHEFKPQKPKRIELANGMIIFLQEDHELPVISGSAVIRGGSREEPAQKISLTGIYGEVWRTGGTHARTGDDLDDYLEARAAKVESSGGSDSTSLSWSCLKEDQEDVFKVFLEVLREPEFRQDKIELAQKQIQTDIARRNDNAGGIASREARKLAYGADSPYVRMAEYATVAAVTREDLLAWHKATVHPNNIILGVSGDFDSQAMEAKLRAVFESWPRGPEVKPPDIRIQDPKPGVYFIEKSDINQSYIRMVHLGTTRDNPDYYALQALNELFGGGFSSRLFSNIRTTKGLAYDVGGGVGTSFDHPGIFQLAMSTKSTTTAAAIDALFAEIDGLAKIPPTAEELKKAKDSILNSFIFRFDSKDKVLHEKMTYEFYHYPEDFLERYQAGIEKITVADVARVAQKYIHKDKLAILLVGKAADFDKPLASYGAVTPIDITIPSMPGAASAPAASNPEGRALIAKIAKAMGSAEKIQSIKSLKQKVNLAIQTPQGEMPLSTEQVTVYPDHAWQKMTSPQGELTMVVTPSAAFMKSPMGSRDMPPSRREATLADLKRDLLYVAQHAEDPEFSFDAGGEEKIGDVTARILSVNAGGSPARWWVDEATGRVLRSAAPAGGPEPGERVTDYSDWKTVDGVTLPFHKVRSQGGEKESTVQILEIEFNPAIDMKIFDKPESVPQQ
jgi:zinc protease